MSKREQSVAMMDEMDVAPESDPPPVPAEKLTAAVEEADADLRARNRDLAVAQAEVNRCMARRASVADAKARSLGLGALCKIGEQTYRAKAPRKPRGGTADPGALWTLEKVEVAT